MKALAILASHGTKNDRHLRKLVLTYQSMTAYSVDVIILVDIARPLPSGVRAVVGAPTRNPKTLPFRHLELFSKHQDDYDLFIYSEDDILVTERNLVAFSRFNHLGAIENCPGFLRYEMSSAGNVSLPDIAHGFHWDPKTVAKLDGHLVAQLTNPHAGVYALDRAQLKHCLQFRSFATHVGPGRFDLLVSAATAPYVRGGIRRFMPLDHIDDLMVHHLSNRYSGRVGLAMSDFKFQIEAMRAIDSSVLARTELLPPAKARPTVRLDKDYDGQVALRLKDFIREEYVNVLSVGLGSGRFERDLLESGIRVTAIALDNISSFPARGEGVRILGTSLDASISQLKGEKFDCIIVANGLQYCAYPKEVLRALSTLLSEDGDIIVSVPNFFRQVLGFLRGRLTWLPISFRRYGIHPTSVLSALWWAHRADLRVRARHYVTRERYRRPPRLVQAIGCTDVVVRASLK